MKDLLWLRKAEMADTPCARAAASAEGASEGRGQSNVYFGKPNPLNRSDSHFCAMPHFLHSEPVQEKATKPRAKIAVTPTLLPLPKMRHLDRRPVFHVARLWRPPHRRRGPQQRHHDGRAAAAQEEKEEAEEGARG